VGWVLATARWRALNCCHFTRGRFEDASDVGARVEEDNTSPLIANFIAEVRRLPDVRAINKG
jgi:hypothetical protein